MLVSNETRYAEVFKRVKTVPKGLPHQFNKLDIVVLPVDANRVECWTLKSYIKSDPKGPIEAIDLSGWFPHGFISMILCTIPGTSRPLPHAYRVLVDAGQTAQPFNRCVDATFGEPWIGNVVVIKIARCAYEQKRALTSIQDAEHGGPLISLVGMCVHPPMFDQFFSPPLTAGVMTGYSVIRGIKYTDQTTGYEHKILL